MGLLPVLVETQQSWTFKHERRLQGGVRPGTRRILIGVLKTRQIAIRTTERGQWNVRELCGRYRGACLHHLLHLPPYFIADHCADDVCQVQGEETATHRVLQHTTCHIQTQDQTVTAAGNWSRVYSERQCD